MWNKSPISGRPKQEKTSQKTIEQIVASLSIKDVTDLDLFLKGMQYQKEQDKNKYTAEEVELVALEMVSWAIDNIGNISAQSGEKFDKVLGKYKNK